jgi:hypothetical protein
MCGGGGKSVICYELFAMEAKIARLIRNFIRYMEFLQKLVANIVDKRNQE